MCASAKNETQRHEFAHSLRAHERHPSSALYCRLHGRSLGRIPANVVAGTSFGPRPQHTQPRPRPGPAATSRSGTRGGKQSHRVCPHSPPPQPRFRLTLLPGHLCCVLAEQSGSSGACTQRATCCRTVRASQMQRVESNVLWSRVPIGLAKRTSATCTRSR
jgi:hypothetical protein